MTQKRKKPIGLKRKEQRKTLRKIRNNVSQEDFGYPMYKCSLCEEIVTPDLETQVSLSTLLSLMGNSHLISLGPLQRFTIHNCGNGSYGVAYIAGIISKKSLIDSTKMPSEIINKESIEPN